MNNIIVSKIKVEKQKGMVILPIEEYKKLIKSAVPTYYLTGKEAKKLDKLVVAGLKEHREDKTVKAGSLKEALKKYARKR